MSEHPEDRQMARLVDADHATVPPPDLAALRAGGRRRLLRRRLALSAATAAVVAVVAVPVAVAGLGDGDRAVEAPPATQGTTQGPSPSATPAPTSAPTSEPGTEVTSEAVPPPPPDVEEVRVPLPGGGSFTGVLETGTVLGETIEMTPYEGYPRFAYAAREGGSTCLSVGVRVDGRIVRMVCTLTIPVDDRWVMWNGYREDPGTYELLGALPGDVDVSIGPDGGDPRPVTTRRTDVLPGYTVFLDEAPWDESWDPLQPAPLTVTTSAGDRYPLSRHTYVS